MHSSCAARLLSSSSSLPFAFTCCRRSYGRTPWQSADSAAAAAAAATVLDVTVQDGTVLDSVLEQHGLVVRETATLDPEHFLPQSRLPSIAGIFNFASSAPLAVAHRRLGTRTQSRVVLPPGSCLLRGAAARDEWTLAIPPLLERTGPGRPVIREVALLMESSAATNRGEEEEGGDVVRFEVHRRPAAAPPPAAEPGPSSS